MGTDLWYYLMYSESVRRIWRGECPSKTRGETFTLPLEIDALYMSGTDTSITAAFAVSSILVILAVILLIAKNILEHRDKGKEGR